MTKATPQVEPHYLYVLMRTDLASMNPGKAVAHGAHAANQFDHAMKVVTNKELLSGYNEWFESASFFGTTITLGVNEAQLKSHIATVTATSDAMIAGEVFDPTYPLRDGEVTHFIPLTTCGFVFGPVSKLKPLLADLDLMR
jgi:hypothetical protein